MEVRMSLADASALLNVAPNTIRSRFKSGKIRGERDNSGKIWVWIDPNIPPSKERRSKPAIEGSKPIATEALIEQLNRVQTELETLRPKAAMADQLQAEKALLLDQLADLKTDRDAWKSLSNRQGFWGFFRRSV